MHHAENAAETRGWTHQTRLYLCIRTQETESNDCHWSLCTGACFYQGFLPSSRAKRWNKTHEQEMWEYPR